MRTEKQLIERYNFLIQEEIKNQRLYGEINRYKRIIEIVQGINPIENKRTLKSKN
jgi:hypothetical protein